MLHVLTVKMYGFDSRNNRREMCGIRVGGNRRMSRGEFGLRSWHLSQTVGVVSIVETGCCRKIGSNLFVALPGIGKISGAVSLTIVTSGRS